MLNGFNVKKKKKNQQFKIFLHYSCLNTGDKLWVFLNSDIFKFLQMGSLST